MKQHLPVFKKNKLAEPHGQGLVEIALLIPLLILIVFGAVDLARAFHAQITITNASREGARFAMRINKDSSIADIDKDDAIISRVVSEAGSSGVTVEGGAVEVFCNGLTYDGPCESGNELEVIVNYDFQLIIGIFFPIDIPLTHSTIMVTP